MRNTRNKILTMLLVLGAIVLVGCGTTKYSITFHTNGGSEVETIHLKKDEKIVLPTNPTKTDYTFEGWFEDDKLEIEFTRTNMPNKNLDLYAKWVKERVTVTFDSRGGTAISSESGKPLDTVMRPADPVKENCIFDDWYTDQTFSTKFSFEFAEDDITVYARWVQFEGPTSLDLNKDWAAGDENAYAIASDATGTTITALAGKGAWSFVKVQIGLNVKYYDSFVMTFEGTEDITFLLKCEQGGIEAVEKSFTIEEGEQTIVWKVGPQNLTNGVEPMNFLIFLNQGNAGAGAELKIKSLKLCRQIEENSTEKSVIFFDSQDGSAVDPLYAEVNSTIVAPANPSRAGYDFMGWFTDEGCVNAFTFDKMPSQKTTLYAKWEANSTVNITYNTNGGSSIPSGQAPAGSNLELPADPTKNNCIFAGWYLDANFETAFNGIVLEDDFTLYAMWKVLEPGTSVVLNDWSTTETAAYNIVVNPSGSTTITSTANKGEWSLVGTKITQNVKDYKTFVMVVKGTEGKTIKLKVESGGVVALENDVVMTGAEQTIYWTVDASNLTDGQQAMNFVIFLNPGIAGEGITLEIMSCELMKQKTEGTPLDVAIFFDSMGGSAVNAIVAAANTSITAPTAPTKGGYTFAGWYTDSNLTQEFVFDKMPSQKTTLYAKWEANKDVTVTFDSKGGSTVDPIKGTAGAQIKTPLVTKTGFIFRGWYTDEACTIAFNNVLGDSNFTVYAKWMSINDSSKLDYNNQWIDKDGGAYTITVTNDETIVASTATKGEWSYIFVNLGNDVVGSNLIRLVVSGAEGSTIMLKSRGVENTITLTGSEQEIIWDVNPFTATDDKEFIIFVGPARAGVGNNVTIKSFALYK